MNNSTQHILSHSLIDYFNEIVIGFNDSGAILFKNKAFNNLTKNAAHVRNLREFKSNTDAFINHLHEKLSSKDEFSYTFSFKIEGIEFILSGKVARYSSPDFKECYIAILEDVTHKHLENRIIALYSAIGNLSKTSSSLEELLEQIHTLLIEEIGANNLFVCLLKEDSKELSFPYLVDEEIGGRQKAYVRPKQNGLTEYIFRTKKAQLLYEEDILSLVASQEAIPTGGIPKVWLGVPLKYADEQVGVIAVKSHSDSNKFNQNHLELLEFISLQIGFVIERQKQEDKIKGQSAVLESIIESGNHLVWSVNKNRQLTSFNSSYAEAIKSIHGKFPNTGPEQRDPLLLSDSKFENLISDKYDLAFKGQNQAYETSFESVKGKVTWREMFLNPIYSENGKIEEISGIAHDVTEKKKVELKLIENEQKFRSIFESFQDIYIKLDSQDKIEIISPSVENILGYTQEELDGKSVHDYFEEHKEGDLDRLTYLLEQKGHVKNFELKIIKKNGRRLPCLVNFSAVIKNNTTIGLAGVIRDISEIQRITDELKSAKKEAENSLKIKESFLANMSHEIRTPMNGIVATVDLLGDSKLSRDQKSHMDTLRGSSQILLNILNDILDLSKLEAGKMEVRNEPVSIKEILQKTYLLFSQSAKQKRINFNFFVEPNIPKKVFSDETRLIQILSNLVSNAIKFTDQKGTVSILTEYEKDGNDALIKFSVKDSGIGISEENTQNLFKSFNQLDSSISKKYGGSGLGLSISDQLCKLLGGKIEVKSRKNEGSTFFFTIRATEVQKFDLNTIKTSLIWKPKKSIKGLNILLVDDMEVNRKVGLLLLKNLKAKTQVASNGNEALTLAKANKFDIILMDIQMPVMDGVTAFNKIREISELKNTKVIAMTAYSMEHDRDNFLSLGFDNYVSKPITKEKILNAILEEPIIINKVDENPGASLFNMEQVNGIKEIGGNEMFIDLLNDFKNEAEDLLKELQISLKNNNRDIILEIVHSIKGSAGSIGLEAISIKTKHIEQSLKENKQIDLKSNVEDIFKEYERFVNWLKSQEKE